MHLRVLFFGQLKDLAGRAEQRIELPDGTTLGGVLDHFAQRTPGLSALSASIVVAKNRAFAPRSEQATEGDEIALLPPVSGGAGNRFELTREPIDAAALAKSLLRGEDGAVATFEGVVRNNTKGRATLYLDYEGYEQMALEVMAALGAELAAKHAIGRIGMVHRLGRMEIGETSVAIVVTAPHRGPAFEAAREAIDRLKRSVPIWKKEHFADGEVWVQGEWDQSLLK